MMLSTFAQLSLFSCLASRKVNPLTTVPFNKNKIWIRSFMVLENNI